MNSELIKFLANFFNSILMFCLFPLTGYGLSFRATLFTALFLRYALSAGLEEARASTQLTCLAT